MSTDIDTSLRRNFASHSENVFCRFVRLVKNEVRVGLSPFLVCSIKQWMLLPVPMDVEIEDCSSIARYQFFSIHSNRTTKERCTRRNSSITAWTRSSRKRSGYSEANCSLSSANWRWMTKGNNSTICTKDPRTMLEMKTRSMFSCWRSWWDEGDERRTNRDWSGWWHSSKVNNDRFHSGDKDHDEP